MKQQRSEKEWETENTALLTFITDDKELVDKPTMFTMVVPTVPAISVVEDVQEQKCTIITNVSFTSEELVVDKKINDFYYDLTNDPTPNRAAGVVSLGYYSVRFTLHNAIIKSTTPLILEAPFGTYESARDKSPMQHVNIHEVIPLRRPL